MPHVDVPGSAGLSYINRLPGRRHAGATAGALGSGNGCSARSAVHVPRLIRWEVTRSITSCGAVVRFHVRDDLHMEHGRIDTAPLPAVGRLAAEYTVVDNVFTTPLDAGHRFSAELRRQLRGVVAADHFHQGRGPGFTEEDIHG